MAYWCENCDVPVLGKICYNCGAKLRQSFPDRAVPVFKPELKLLSELTGILLNFEDCKLWTANRCYYYQGKKVFKIEGGNLFERPRLKWFVSELPQGQSFNRQNLVSANLPYLMELEYKAILFIQEVKEKFADYPFWTVAFSGGKDSAVVSHLVRKAFGTNNILHIFVDTTMELPPTYEYISKFKKMYNIPIIEVSSGKNYKELWEKAGPPSRIHRWCCTIFKTSPYDKFLKEIAITGKKIVTFEGIRACESKMRSKYLSIGIQPKISTQVSARPLLNWNELEIWLYILAERIIFNSLYKKGMRRVGCSICPFDSFWSEMILIREYPKHIIPFIELLKNYTQKIQNRIRKNNFDYIASGGWKKRHGGFGIQSSSLEFVTEKCLKESWVYFYTLNKEIDKFFLELFKPFGEIRLIGTNKNLPVYFVISPNFNPLFLIEILNNNYLKLKILGGKNYNDKRKLKRQFENQIAKFQNCVLCGACASVCGQSAISLNGKYVINEKLCNNCLKCIYVCELGCIIAKSLQLPKEGEKNYELGCKG